MIKRLKSLSYLMISAFFASGALATEAFHYHDKGYKWTSIIVGGLLLFGFGFYTLGEHLLKELTKK